MWNDGPTALLWPNQVSAALCGFSRHWLSICQCSLLPRCPAKLHFPASFVVRCGHVIEFWPMESEQKPGLWNTTLVEFPLHFPTQWLNGKASRDHREGQRLGGKATGSLNNRLQERKLPRRATTPGTSAMDQMRNTLLFAGLQKLQGLWELLASLINPEVCPHSCPALLAKANPAIWSYTVENWHLPAEWSSWKRHWLFPHLPVWGDSSLDDAQGTWIQPPNATGAHEEKVLNVSVFWHQGYHVVHSPKCQEKCSIIPNNCGKRRNLELSLFLVANICISANFI